MHEIVLISFIVQEAFSTVLLKIDKQRYAGFHTFTHQAWKKRNSLNPRLANITCLPWNFLRILLSSIGEYKCH